MSDRSAREQPTYTRRDIIKIGATAVVAAGTAGTIGAIDTIRRGFIIQTTSNSNQPEPVRPIESGIDPNLTLVYNYLGNSADGKRAVELVKRVKEGSYKEFFLDPNNKLISDTLRYKPIIKEVCENAALSSSVSKEWLEKVMLGLIFTESRGDPNAGGTPTNKGRGLTQLEPAAVLEAKKAAKLPDNINVLDPKTNITLAVYYLDKLLNLYRDPTLSLWAYNLGEGNINDAILTYAKSKADKNTNSIEREKEFKEIEGIFSKTPTQENFERGTHILVKNYHMNAVNVSEDPFVQAVLATKKPPILSTTYEYVPRIAASTQLLNAA